MQSVFGIEMQIFAVLSVLLCCEFSQGSVAVNVWKESTAKRQAGWATIAVKPIPVFGLKGLSV